MSKTKHRTEIRLSNLQIQNLLRNKPVDAFAFYTIEFDESTGNLNEDTGAMEDFEIYLLDEYGCSMGTAIGGYYHSNTGIVIMADELIFISELKK